MPEHAATATVTAVRLSTAIEAMNGRDKNRNNILMVAHPAAVLGDKDDLVPMVAISMASSVGRSVLFVLIKDHLYLQAGTYSHRDHLYHLEALIARAGLHHFRVR